MKNRKYKLLPYDIIESVKTPSYRSMQHKLKRVRSF